MERRLAAILVADVVGYSKLMGEDQAGTLAALREFRASLLGPTVITHQGHVIKNLGDGWIIEFPSITDAVAGAIEIQQGLEGHDLIQLRIGVHIGDVVFEQEDVFGDGVNVAARLEAIAEPGEVLISDTAQQSLDGKTARLFGGGERHELKNITRPIVVWRWPPERDESNANDTDIGKLISGFNERPAIAVLPFDNLSSDPDQSYFADGIAEDLLTRLAMWRWLPVIARNSSFCFKGQAIGIQEIGRKLRARYILEGSVRKAGSTVRISGQLIETENGHQLWADKFDGQLDDIFDLQDRITDEIVTALEPIVGRAESKRAHHLAPGEFGVWDRTQRALWYYNKYTKTDLEKALELLLPVIDETPDFTQALAIAAMANLSLALFLKADDPQSAMRKAAEFAHTAVASDPLHPMANAVSGYVNAYRGRHKASVNAGLKALQLNPSFAMGYHAIGLAYVFNGQHSEGIDAIKEAMRLSPFDHMMPMWLATLSAAYYLSQDYEIALEAAEAAIEKAPKYALALRAKPSALAKLGRLDEARDALKEFLAVSPNYTVARGRSVLSFRNEADFEHYMDGLRMAGLPEE